MSGRTVHERKAALRAELRAVRRAVTADPGERARRSATIWAGIVPLLDLGGHGLDLETAPAQMRRRIMLFRSLPTEPDTADWFASCRRVGFDTFEPLVVEPELRVEPGDVDPRALDVVVVPGLGFTSTGQRLGQGGGHYDRFLARLRPDTITIGVCFAEQLVRQLPTAPHDRPVDHVVTG